jgi:uncharacterized protein
VLTDEQAGGALLFIVGLLGWYMTFVMMSAEMGLAVNLPVGDLSHYWVKHDQHERDLERGKTD